MTEYRNEKEQLRGWFAGRLPEDWFTEAPEIVVDRDEVTVIGKLTPPRVGEDSTDAERAAAEEGKIRQFRVDTREKRIRIAGELEHISERKVAWGAVCGGTKEIFTSLSSPVMTRLRQRERLVLDTLVDAGVAKSRSEALAWCVRLVGRHSDSWLAELREALQHVEQVRVKGPVPSQGSDA